MRALITNTLIGCAIETPLGEMVAAASDEGITLLEFRDRRALPTQWRTLAKHFGGEPVEGDHPHLRQLRQELAAYFAEGSELTRFEVPLHAPGTPFQMRVWDQLRLIPHGRTCSYAQLAVNLGDPAATRAVARANGDNRIAILIPCHRVIGADGSLTGYGGKLWRKRWLLDHERGERPLIPGA